MIDVLIPVNPDNAPNVVFNAMADLADHTDVPLRFIVCAQGGVKSDWKVVRDFLDCLRDDRGMHYGLMAHERKLGTPLSAVLQGLDLIKHEDVLIMRPEVVITDDQWFDKMVGPLRKAPYVGGVFLPSEFSGSATLDPHSLNDQSEIYATSAVLTTRAHLEMVKPIWVGDVEEFDILFQAELVKAGSIRWMHCGVRFQIHNASTWTER